MQADDFTSQTIQWLRFPLAILLVLLHAGVGGVESTLPVFHTLSIMTTEGGPNSSSLLFPNIRLFVFPQYGGMDYYPNGKLR